MSTEIFFLHAPGEPIDTEKYSKIIAEMKNNRQIGLFLEVDLLEILSDLDKRKFTQFANISKEDYEIGLYLGGRISGESFFMYFPKDPNYFEIISNLDDRWMSPRAISIILPWLIKLRDISTRFSINFDCDGADTPPYEERDDYKDSWSVEENSTGDDFAACSLDDCGYCGKCMY